MNVLPTSYPDIKLPEGTSTGEPPKEQVALTAPELRHLVECLNFKFHGRWDEQTDSWTYPVQIRAKLRRMLEGQ